MFLKIGHRLFVKGDFDEAWEPTEFYCYTDDCFTDEAEKLKQEAAKVYPLARALRWVELLEETE
jgi:hypothetical protein